MVTFTWTLDGNTVFVTGTFTNWTNHIAMQRDGHVFSTTIVPGQYLRRNSNVDSTSTALH
jgi:hypothetical protein